MRDLASISETSAWSNSAVASGIGGDGLIRKKGTKKSGKRMRRIPRGTDLVTNLKNKQWILSVILSTTAKKEESKSTMAESTSNDTKWLAVMRVLREYICLRCAIAGIDDHSTVDLIMEQYISSFVTAIIMLRARLKQLKTGGDIIDPVNTVDDVKPTSFLQMVSTVTPVVTGSNDPQFEAAAQFANALFTRFPFTMEELRSLQVSLSGALGNDFFSLQLRNERLMQWTSATTYTNDDLEDYIAATTVRHDESQAGSLTTLVSRHAAIAELASPSISTASDHAPSGISAATLSSDSADEVSPLNPSTGSDSSDEALISNSSAGSTPTNSSDEVAASNASTDSAEKTEASATPSDYSAGSTHASLILYFKTTYSSTGSAAPTVTAVTATAAAAAAAAGFPETAYVLPDPSADRFNEAYMKLQVDDPSQSTFAARNPTGDRSIADGVTFVEVTTSEVPSLVVATRPSIHAVASHNPAIDGSIVDGAAPFAATDNEVPTFDGASPAGMGLTGVVETIAVDAPGAHGHHLSSFENAHSSHRWLPFRRRRPFPTRTPNPHGDPPRFTVDNPAPVTEYQSHKRRCSIM